MKKKLKKTIEEMPRPAYIFLKSLFALAALMLLISCLLFTFGENDLTRQHFAVLFLESPAGVLLLGVIGVAILLDCG